MKRLILGSLLLLFALVIYAQTTGSLLLPLWDWTARRYVWYTLGSGFTITGQTISVTSVAQPVRVYDVKLTRDPDGSYQLPTGALSSSVVVHVNGLRYVRGVDYTIVGGKVTPSYTWALDTFWDVRVDYDR